MSHDTNSSADAKPRTLDRDFIDEIMHNLQECELRLKALASNSRVDWAKETADVVNIRIETIKSLYAYIESLDESNTKELFNEYGDFLRNIKNSLNLDTKVKHEEPKPYSSCTKLSATTFVEGYWWSEEEPSLPFPIETKVPVDAEFLKKLEAVIKVSPVQHSYGMSWCRICKCSNGSGEYIITNKHNVRFRVPEGLLHYYKVHNVHPSKEFTDFMATL
jgi:hypothetical protein